MSDAPRPAVTATFGAGVVAVAIGAAVEQTRDRLRDTTDDE